MNNFAKTIKIIFKTRQKNLNCWKFTITLLLLTENGTKIITT